MSNSEVVTRTIREWRILHLHKISALTLSKFVPSQSYLWFTMIFLKPCNVVKMAPLCACSRAPSRIATKVRAWDLFVSLLPWIWKMSLYEDWLVGATKSSNVFQCWNLRLLLATTAMCNDTSSAWDGTTARANFFVMLSRFQPRLYLSKRHWTGVWNSGSAVVFERILVLIN